MTAADSAPELQAGAVVKWGAPLTVLQTSVASQSRSSVPRLQILTLPIFNPSSPTHPSKLRHTRWLWAFCQPPMSEGKCWNCYNMDFFLGTKGTERNSLQSYNLEIIYNLVQPPLRSWVRDANFALCGKIHDIGSFPTCRLLLTFLSVKLEEITQIRQWKCRWPNRLICQWHAEHSFPQLHFQKLYFNRNLFCAFEFTT